MLFHASEVDAEALQRAKLLHYGTISLISEPSRSATLHAIELAREAGCVVSCDPNLRLALWPDRDVAREGLFSAIAQTQVVKMSDHELRFLTGSDDPAATRQQLWHDQRRVAKAGHHERASLNGVLRTSDLPGNPSTRQWRLSEKVWWPVPARSVR